MPLEVYKCLGPYGVDFGEKTGGGGSSWHPGMKGHKVRGNMMSYFLLEVLKDAVETILEERRSLTAKEIKRKSQAFLLENQMQAPPQSPIACDPDVCDSDPVCFTEFEPRVSHSLRDIVIGQASSSASSNWTLDVSFFDIKAILKAQLKGRGYIDKKFLYMSHSVDDPLSIIVKPSKTSRVWLCELQKGFLQYPAYLGDLDAFADVYIDKHIPTPKNITALNSYVSVKGILIFLLLS
jgi:hypothetical protein